MKYTSLLAVVALIQNTSAVTIKQAIAEQSEWAPVAPGPYASHVDHLSTECYGADDDDIMYDVFERYRVEERNPLGAGTGIWKLPKSSGPAWAADVIRRFNVMADDQVDAYVKANFDNFWKKYDNNGTGEIYESEGEVFMRALLGPNNRFRLAPGAISDLGSTAQILQNEFSAVPEKDKFAHRYDIKPVSKHYPTLSEGYAGRASTSNHALDDGKSVTAYIPGPL